MKDQVTPTPRSPARPPPGRDQPGVSRYSSVLPLGPVRRATLGPFERAIDEDRTRDARQAALKLVEPARTAQHLAHDQASSGRRGSRSPWRSGSTARSSACSGNASPRLALGSEFEPLGSKFGLASATARPYAVATWPPRQQRLRPRLPTSRPCANPPRPGYRPQRRGLRRGPLDLERSDPTAGPPALPAARSRRCGDRGSVRARAGACWWRCAPAATASEVPQSAWRTGDRSLADEGDQGRPAGAHRQGRGRCALGRARPRDAASRIGDGRRDRHAHRHRGAHQAAGIGWLMRKHGATVDNLVSVDLVTADGEVLSASEDENRTLPGPPRRRQRSGIVTSFEYRLHRVGPIVLPDRSYHPLEDARECCASIASSSPRHPMS